MRKLEAYSLQVVVGGLIPPSRGLSASVAESTFVVQRQPGVRAPERELRDEVHQGGCPRSADYIAGSRTVRLVYLHDKAGLELEFCDSSNVPEGREGHRRWLLDKTCKMRTERNEIREPLDEWVEDKAANGDLQRVVANTRVVKDHRKGSFADYKSTPTRKVSEEFLRLREKPSYKGIQRAADFVCCYQVVVSTSCPPR